MMRIFGIHLLLCLTFSALALAAVEGVPEKIEDRTDWWSLKPLAKTLPLGVKGGAASMIDAFVDAKLTALHFEAAPEADARTLIRRVSFDLIGLPPAPEEIDQFVRQSAA